MPNGKDINYVLDACRTRGVRFVQIWFADILGFLKSVAISVEKLPEAFDEGIGFDGSAIQGFTRADESDMVAVPDPSTFALLPWRPTENAVARMFCDIRTPDGAPFEGDPRYVLKRNLERARKLGFTLFAGPEVEYFYLKDALGGEPLDRGGYFDALAPDDAIEMRRAAILALEAMGIPVDSSHHEGAPSQYEIVPRVSEALAMADAVATLRLVVKETAQARGCGATFMPKPYRDRNGSGMHLNLSLFRGERNAFFDPADPVHLSDAAKRFIAGLLRHAPEMLAVTNQWVNSYKRLVPGFEAPVFVSWARRNRADLVRVPQYKPGKERSARIELRSPDPACNPYLALAVVLAAGLEGIEKGYDLPPALEENIQDLSEQARRERGLLPLPGSLIEAVALAEKSDLLRRALGDHLFANFIRNKKKEWEDFRTYVTSYEIERYLPIL